VCGVLALRWTIGSDCRYAQSRMSSIRFTAHETPAFAEAPARQARTDTNGKQPGEKGDAPGQPGQTHYLSRGADPNRFLISCLWCIPWAESGSRRILAETGCEACWAYRLGSLCSDAFRLGPVFGCNILFSHSRLFAVVFYARTRPDSAGKMPAGRVRQGA
jgi:hypothetical protein